MLNASGQNDAAAVPSPFVSAPIESVMDSLVGAIAAQTIRPSTKPPIAVLITAQVRAVCRLRRTAVNSPAGWTPRCGSVR